ncbi:FKBP-type peptidyl-prolyl cis-trans isomerase [Desulfohalovibrio reitneri]|uniref:FKBP-type peptidyl-prolyl cis-trans isomerase n=1 Tax=Desulfohalovibrio reitneri TaxID=1307759 RepID=UPI0004A6DAE8|nr:peptidylprolyl isomerase [Desulfohalovibrio reitneri]
MAQAKEGDKVKVHYTGKLDDGTVFDSSEGREPLEFKVGDQMVIPGFENAVVGLEEGESTTISFGPEDGYGNYQEGLSANISKEQIPEHIQPEVGMMLQFTTETGEPAHVVVTEIGEEEITLDANHPLAGQNLTFEITLQEIE